MSSNSLAIIIESSKLPESVLTHLQDGWQGSLNDGGYSNYVNQLAGRIVEGSSADGVTLKQLKTLGMMGVDLGNLRGFEDKASKVAVKSEMRSKQTVLQEVREDQERVKRKFIGQLGNDESEDGALPFERASFKGMLVAELEKHRGIVSEKFLTSAKRSLVLDARRGAGALGQVKEKELTRELERLEINDPDSFIWCSSTETTKHALDTVVRRVITKDAKVMFEFTTCNRGKGAVILSGPEKDRVQALSSYWSDSNVLAKEWANQTWAGLALEHDAYEQAMHPNKETNPNYRPQSPQKKGNCAAKSMLAALNFLIEGPGDGSKYKAIKESLKSSLGVPRKVQPVAMAAAAASVEVELSSKEIRALSGDVDRTIGFLVTKFSEGRVPSGDTLLNLRRHLPANVQEKLKASGHEWAKIFI